MRHVHAPSPSRVHSGRSVATSKRSFDAGSSACPYPTRQASLREPSCTRTCAEAAITTRRKCVINEETIQKLIELKLTTMAKALRELGDMPPATQLSFEERIGMLVDREWTDRENRRLARRLKEAKLGVRASLEDVTCDAARGIEKGTIRQLATCQWVRAKQNVIAIGAT